MVKDKTGGERQSRLRLARSKWLKEHGFNSAEGLLGALMRGEVVLQVASVPTPRAADEGDSQPPIYVFSVRDLSTKKADTKPALHR